MSEITTAVAAPVAAPETVAAPQVETQAPVQPQQPATATEARRTLSERVRTVQDTAAPPAGAQQTAPVVDALGNLHDPSTGQFAPKEGEPAALPAASAPGQVAPSTTESAAESAADPFVTIELRPDHPLRERGRDSVRVHPDDVEAVRSLANSPVRRREVEDATRAALDWQTEAHARAAEADALRQQLQAFVSGTGLSEDFDTLRELEAYSPAAAEAYRDRMLRQALEPVDGVVEQARQQAQEQAAQYQLQAQAGQMAAEFTGRIVQEGHVPLWGQAQVAAALEEFGARVEFFEQRLGRPVQPTYEDWLGFVAPKYAADPRVMHAMGQQWATSQAEQQERLRREAAEHQRKELEEAARNAASNPLGALRGVQGIAAPAVGARPQPTNAFEARKNLRARFSGVG